MIFFHPQTKTPQPRLGGWAFALLVAVFALLVPYRLVIGLSGLGVLSILIAVLVELNAPRVWAESLKWQKKSRKRLPWYHRPTTFYYNLNTYVLWPVVFILGVTLLVMAYRISQ